MYIVGFCENVDLCSQLVLGKEYLKVLLAVSAVLLISTSLDASLKPAHIFWSGSSVRTRFIEE